MKIGILREEKIPLDRRVALTPEQCRLVMDKYPSIEILVRSSAHRCYSDDMYQELGIQVVDQLDDCDILIGIKEVPVNSLIKNKTYLFFSHTIKKQEYNRDLLLAMVNSNIQMIDYEVLKNDHGKRIIGFGRYAGVVGAYNGLLAYGLKKKLYRLKPAYSCRDRKEMEMEFKKILLRNEKIIVTGKGRVGKGIMEIINSLAIREVSKTDFIEKSFSEPVCVHLDYMDYYERKDDGVFIKNDFYNNPDKYRSSFMKFASVGDIFIAGHYYSKDAPFLFTRDDAKKSDFNLSVIADVSCDIDGPVASTIRPSTILNPIYGYNPLLEKEDDFTNNSVIAVMAVDNLPCELPKDASLDFGEELINNIFPLLVQENNDTILDATICKEGKLTLNFEYLTDFLYQD